MMNKTLALTLASATLLPFSALAADIPLVDFTIGAGNWDHSPSGFIQYDGDEIDLEDDLNLGKESEGYIFARLEHPIPLIPNIKVSRTGLTTSGSGTLSVSRDFGGITYHANENVDSEVILDHTDIALYYGLPIPLIDIDFGINVKMIDGEATITGENSGTETTSFSAPVPMGYLAANIGLPLTGLSIGAEAAMLAIGDSSISDITLKAAYETSFFLGIEGGVRTIKMKLDEADFDDFNSDVTFEGPFVNAFLKF